MAVYPQTLWAQQQAAIYNQETIFLRNMGAMDTVIQQATANAIVSVEFEVFGHVQGVYFTKYCRDMCAELKIGGWVKNSKKGTIVGKMQGDKIRVDQMLLWLSRTGSPGCKIERCETMNWEFLAALEYRNFSIRF